MGKKLEVPTVKTTIDPDSFYLDETKLKPVYDDMKVQQDKIIKELGDLANNLTTAINKKAVSGYYKKACQNAKSACTQMKTRTTNRKASLKRTYDADVTQLNNNMLNKRIGDLEAAVKALEAQLNK